MFANTQIVGNKSGGEYVGVFVGVSEILCA